MPACLGQKQQAFLIEDLEKNRDFERQVCPGFTQEFLVSYSGGLLGSYSGVLELNWGRGRLYVIWSNVIFFRW